MTSPCNIIFPMLVLTLFPVTSPAQTANTEAAAAASEVRKKPSAIELNFYAEAGIEYSDNVYHLGKDQIRSLEKPDQGDASSGRFDDMESVSDVIIEPRIGLRLKSPGLFSGRFGLTTWIQYNAYIENEACSHPEAELGINHSIGKNGRVSMEWKYLDGFFKKNYLSAVNDANGNGNIPKEERIYSPAFYDESEGTLVYKHNVLKNKGGLLSRLGFEPFAGWGRRSYNARFRNRDKRIIFGGVGSFLEFSSKLDLDIAYQYDEVKSPGKNELVLFDETVNELDINGDGEIKSNAALITPVDRSCFRHSIKISPSLELSDDCSLFAMYKWRKSSYQSNNQLDIDHYNETACRRQIKAGLAYDFSKTWSARIEYEITSDEAEEDDEGYRENKVSVTVKYRIN